MAGYIGSKASVVSSGAERKKTFAITTNTTSLTGLSYTVNQVHVFHNGVRLVDGTDYTATNGTSITLTSAAENGDEVVVISYASFQPSDTVSASAGGTFAGDVNFGDNNKAIFGAGSDLQIYHSGSHSVIKDAGDGNLQLIANDFQLRNGADNANMMTGANGGAITLMHNGSSKLATTSTGVDITGTLTSDGLTVDGTGQVTGGNSAGIDTRFTVASSGNGGAGRGVGLVLAPAGSSNSVEAVRLVGLQQTSAATANNASFVVQVANTSGTLTERIRISSAGHAYFITSGNEPSASQTGVRVSGVNGSNFWKSSNSGTSGYDQFVFYNGNGLVGTITTSGSGTSYNTSSDYRLKTDAQPMTGASARVQALNPVNFEWIADGTRVDGFLAHEAQAVVPEAVTGTKDAMRDEEYEVTPAVLDDDGNVVTEAVMGTRSVPDYQGIDQSKLVPLLTAALQEALTKIDTMETRLAALEAV